MSMVPVELVGWTVVLGVLAVVSLVVRVLWVWAHRCRCGR